MGKSDQRLDSPIAQVVEGLARGLLTPARDQQLCLYRCVRCNRTYGTVKGEPPERCPYGCEAAHDARDTAETDGSEVR